MVGEGWEERERERRRRVRPRERRATDRDAIVRALRDGDRLVDSGRLLPPIVRSYIRQEYALDSVDLLGAIVRGEATAPRLTRSGEVVEIGPSHDVRRQAARDLLNLAIGTRIEAALDEDTVRGVLALPALALAAVQRDVHAGLLGSGTASPDGTAVASPDGIEVVEYTEPV